MALTGSVVTAGAASAAVSPTAAVIIDEVYGGGGNAGAPFKRDFVELYNPGGEPVSLAGWSIQYTSATGPSWTNTTPLSGSIAAGGSVLVGGAGGSTGAEITVDVDGAIAFGASAGKVALVSSTTPLSCSVDCGTVAAVVDLVGFGSNASSYAGSGPALGASNTQSVARTGHVNTADNAADFTAGTPSPLGGGLIAPEQPEEPTEPVTIAQIQGTGDASPLAGTTVTTSGVVTAAYPTGGRNGYVIQTAGTGGALGERTASDGLFVYSPSTDDLVEIGDNVTVTGVVSEFNGQTQLTVANAAGLEVLTGTGTVTPLTGAWPRTAAAREAMESMLFLPSGDLTVSNTYSTNQYGEVGLATGTKPLLQWTEVADPQDTAAIQDVKADNAARGVVLDDGATTNYLSAANQGLTPPYVSLTDPVRVGAGVTFVDPVVVTWVNNTWKLDPTQALVGSTNGPATFENTRTAAPEAVGGDVTVASFNVLNYFTTLGASTASCVAYKDRTGDGVTVDEGCNQRGAWDADDLERQQDKIVAAINALDADVVGLLEIENSLKVDGVPDEALATLVGALNAAAGSTKWAYVPSSGELPVVGEMDVITNALIYQPAAVVRRGPARALGTLSTGTEPFGNAREPIAQAFAPVGGGEPVLVVVNHFKSKGSAGPLGTPDTDLGDGQGAANASRVAQATALRDWVPTIQGDVEAVALVGDFNSYTKEDPLEVLYDAGYVDATEELSPGEYSYSFSGLAGSLDHVLLNEAALDRATGADVWEINSPESIALEYSRYNYHGSLFYAADPYRSSDHDPVIVGLSAAAAAETVDLTFLNINDFHGRIDANTVKFAGTVEAERANATGPVAFLSAGDNIGASLFASATQDDQPTIDVLNALDLAASAVGNHEFDKGFTDLTDRVIGASGDENAAWSYLGANVYAKGTKNPVLPEFELVDMGGVTVGVIGAVTQETPTLVTPAGIADLDFGDPVEAVNRVAAQLSDGEAANGEADVLVAEYHDGAGAGTPDGATLVEELAAGGAFAEIVQETSAKVDVIFTGHTHKQYAWSAPVPGVEGKTRPVLQTGSYGEFLGKVVLTYDTTTDEVLAHAESNVARSTVADATLVGAYPRVAEVKTIVDAALAHAQTVGSVPVGSVTADITTAFTGGSYVDGRYQGSAPGTTTGRDDRANESTLGNLVANSLRESLADETRGGAQIGVVNPGGLRAELLYAPDGVITTAEANGVLPFVNNLWTTTLTGEQFVTLLEQQWQTNRDGSIPSRPYLQLGLSDNVSYTYDPAAPRGEHITSVTVDGEPLDLSAEYRIGTFSFLATGGDNFRVFEDATDTRDSGLVDRDAWIAYLQANEDLAPDFARHAVAVTDLPTTVVAGEALDLAVAKLDLTSLGSPLNTSVDVRLDGESIGTATVTDGAATITSTVPAGTTAGEHVLTLVAAPSGTTVTIPLTVEEATPSTIDLTFLNINDFHGRIDANTVKFAGTVEQQRAAADGPVAFLSAGDNIGASLFASATQDDQPTIDVLNALDLKAAAIANHELDKGFTDLTDRVMDEADWSYLGANVYAKGTKNPVLPEFELVDMGGVTVGVIGAVTQETPSLVTPAGIADLDFGDPVEAVNRVAAQLSDGDAANGEADVLVAEYHEGAGAGTPDGATLVQELAAGGAFAQIVQDTSAKVDVIFTGHTHKQYAWAAPVPGVEGKTRPVLQTGSYGEFLGKVVLTYDTATDEVLTHTEQNVARTTTADTELVTAYPRVAEVKTIVDAALAHAAVVGSQPVGSVTADITTAFAGGSYVDGRYQGPGPLPTTGRDDRASESTLGNLVASSLRETLSSDLRGGAQIGVVNPGGLRGELLYARSGAEAQDGIVTYAEANGVLPFVNNLWTTTLTGEQFVTLLEQQWQTNRDGSIPSRPYLQLGLSDNVSYTYDPAAPRGEHITSVTVDGEPLDPSAEYRIGTFSFLATGGDNFRVFEDATDTRDSGLVDRDAWIAYLQANEDLAPDFARHAVAVTDQPTEAFAGDAVTFGVSRLDLTSLGSPLNTSVDVRLDDESIGGATVSGGAATIAVVIPAATTAGDHELTLVAAPSGTTVTIPLTVKAPTATATTLTVLGDRTAGATQTLVAQVDLTDVAGTVTFLDGATWLDTVAVRYGKATLDVELSAGTHDLRAVFRPSDGRWGTSTGSLTVSIAKAATTTALVLSPSTVKFGGAVTARVTVTGATVAPAGTVQIRKGGTVLATATLAATGKVGKATVVLPRTLGTGTHTLTAVYAGSSSVAGSSDTATLKVTAAKPSVTLGAASWTVKKGSQPKVTVTVTGAANAPVPTGKVTLVVGSKTLTGTLSGGQVTFTLPKVTTSVTVKATYAGNGGYTSVSASKRLTVR
ncbi:ExeM/NucH family extracellular endonuclease [Cellulomonas gilvus]|uniref:ExeM/NucH family extracellular endonuclease n=1 Tax=Cellulomonas gilvus TaxID=11 RepID=UPI001FE003BB|nr:ExeM/NucH family extracellular endonuclease [Cellulomonas gilvus]